MIVAGFLSVFITALNAEPGGHLTYTLSTENSQTPEGRAANARIKIAIDSALYYYNTYTTLTKELFVRFDTSVGIAEANFDGRISFGKGNRASGNLYCTT